MSVYRHETTRVDRPKPNIRTEEQYKNFDQMVAFLAGVKKPRPAVRMRNKAKA